MIFQQVARTANGSYSKWTRHRALKSRPHAVFVRPSALQVLSATRLCIFAPDASSRRNESPLPLYVVHAARECCVCMFKCALENHLVVTRLAALSKRGISPFFLGAFVAASFSLGKCQIVDSEVPEKKKSDTACCSQCSCAALGTALPLMDGIFLFCLAIRASVAHFFVTCVFVSTARARIRRHVMLADADANWALACLRVESRDSPNDNSARFLALFAELRSLRSPLEIRA